MHLVANYGMKRPMGQKKRVDGVGPCLHTDGPFIVNNLVGEPLLL